MIEPLCKVRKGFLTTKFDTADEIQILHSEIGFNYLKAPEGRLPELKKSI